MNRYLTYVTSIGFHGVAVARSAKCEAHPRELRAFSYEGFDPLQVKNSIGRPKLNAENLLLWIISRDRAIRVDSERQIVLLGEGRNAVRALRASIEARKD